jgi:PAS domain S-box-containing protein
MNGENASQFAVGKITHEPGLYFSSPVVSAGKVIGVVVVKVDIARMTHHIDLSGVLIADENGVVVLAEDAAFAMKAIPGATVKNMPNARRRQIYLRDQFESIDIQPWPGKAHLFKIGNVRTPYLLNVTSVDRDTIKIFVLADASPILQMDREFLRIFFLITLCGSALIVIGAGMVWYSYNNNRTSAQLQRQHDELDQAQHLAKIGSWSYDYTTRQAQCSKEYRINFLMQDVETQKAPPTVRQTLEFVHPDDRERIKKAYIEGIGQGRGYSAQYRMVRRDGEVRYVKANAVIEKDSAGNPVKITGTCRDVTDEHRALLALEDSEKHLRRVLNSSLIGIIQGNDSGKILDMNQAFMSLTGYRTEDLKAGRLTWQNMATLEFQQLNALNIFGLNTTPAPFEMDLLTASGNTVQVLIGLAKVEDARSEWVCFVLDLSERNRVNRIQSEFISVVSHELRTPLTSIRGSLSLLESGMLDGNPGKKAELIRIAHRNSQRLIGIVNDILDMEKLAAGKMVFDMHRVNMTEVIDQAVEFNTGFAQQFDVKFVALEFPAHATVCCDSGRLMQVITNLMSNAAKFSPAGGVVDLRLVRSQERWRFAICDHGPGIAEEFRSRIFGAFSQAEDANTRQKGGTGLGLNITKIMVEKMGGSIGFDSVPGQGATFWIEFSAQD